MRTAHTRPAYRALWLLLCLTVSWLPAACRLPGRAEPTPTPVATAVPVIPIRNAAVAKASGEIRPARLARLGFATQGRVLQIQVAQGDVVAAGDLLVQLDDRRAQAAVAQARATWMRARAAQEALQQGARPQEIAAAQAQLDAARARLAQLTAGSRSEEVEAARADLAAAQARYVAVVTGPEDARATALAQIQQAQARLHLALSPATENQVAEAEAQVRALQAQVALLQAGPGPGVLAEAAAAVTEAEALLQQAEVGLAELSLSAPFAGTVTALAINPGETAQPGQVVLTLADLESLQAETTDLSERDIAGIRIGQAATVYVEALDTSLPGQVAQIAAQPSTIGGDVVYTTVIRLQEPPPALRWGMSVEVEIGTEP